MGDNDIRYLKCLAKRYPTIAETATEIINLQSILSLPKGTEHFITDIHGEYEQFQHIIKNASGAIKQKIEEEFGSTISQKEKFLESISKQFTEKEMQMVSNCGAKCSTLLIIKEINN